MPSVAVEGISSNDCCSTFLTLPKDDWIRNARRRVYLLFFHPTDCSDSCRDLKGQRQLEGGSLMFAIEEKSSIPCYVLRYVHDSLDRGEDDAGSVPLPAMDSTGACFTSLYQPFEQQYSQQEQLFGIFPSAAAFVPTLCYSLDQPLSMDLMLSISALMEKNQEEVDQYLRLQNERLVEALFEQRKQHMESLVNNLQAKAAMLLKTKEDELTMERMRCQELLEKLKKAEDSKEKWKSIARINEAKFLSLRNALEHMQRTNFSMMNETKGISADPNFVPLMERTDVKKETVNTDKIFFPCKCCGSRSTCQLLLPCRHLCACKQCANSLAACPLCNSEKMGSVKVLF